MVGYPKSIKFYKIYSDQEPNLIYIGSTVKRLLCQRMGQHREDCKKNKGCASEKIISKYNDAKIELIEEQECADLAARNKIERNLTEQYGGCNIKVQGRTKEEYMIKWNADNKEYYKEYYENHKEHYQQQKAEHYKRYKDYMNEESKQYRENNKEAIRAQKREPIICECGIKTDRGHISRHRKTLKHIIALDKLTNESV
jgi:hypothetical protein